MSGLDAPPIVRRLCALDNATSPRGWQEIDAADAASLGFDAGLIVATAEHGLSDVTAIREARALRDAGLHAVADFDLRRHPALDPVVADHPDWFHAPQLPDPRAGAKRFAEPTHAVARDHALQALHETSLRRLTGWLDGGIRGLRVVGIDAASIAPTIALIAAVRSTHPCAWVAVDTAGVPESETNRLLAAGVDAAFSSLAWWDGQASWYYEEVERLRRIAKRVLCTVDAPDSRRTGAPLDALIAFATATSDGFVASLPPTAATHRRASLTEATFLADAGRALLHRVQPLMRGRRDGAIAVVVDRVEGTPSRELVLANFSATAAVRIAYADLASDAGDGAIADLANSAPAPSVSLAPGECRRFPLLEPRAISSERVGKPERSACAATRIAIENVGPVIDGGRFPVKRCVGDRVRVSADIFSDGHDRLAAAVVHRDADSRTWRRAALRDVGNDRWEGEFTVSRLGRHEFAIEAWRDDFSTLRDGIDKKWRAGVLEPVDLEDACRAIEAVRARARSSTAAALKRVIAALRAAIDLPERAAIVLAAGTAAAVSAADERPFAARSPDHRIDVDRLAARYASWYELFPRSSRADSGHGSFDDVIAELPSIREMGFDVLYMPPIHPIGTTHRKGKNNSLDAGADEPGSPYAIGAVDGGHAAVHRDLGGIDGFLRLVAAATALGMEIALDFAVQCSPDHPWLRDHPDWFERRSDGSVRHAENPPKKYEDIVNVDFYADRAIPSLWEALRDVVLFWAGHGVRTFRVDNPHTKPLPFWEWLIASVRARHADVIFLSEAFTRPKPMYRLAKLGFSQSYTYFTWRNDKQALTSYLQELNAGAPREAFRPHFFVNTPDINPYFLQQHGRTGHLVRAALATTLSGLWGMYAGFELCEAAALPGREEYLDSEKYEVRPRRRRGPDDIVDEITALNRVRRLNPELQTHLGVEFLQADNGEVLYFAKGTAAAGTLVLIAINLDPDHAQTTRIEVPLWKFGLGDDASVAVEALLDAQRFDWHGKHQWVTLDLRRPYALWRISASGPADADPRPAALSGEHA